MTTRNQALNYFIETVKAEINNVLDNIEDESIEKVKEIILESINKGGRVHVTGIGKPGHLAGYAASLLSSTGTPAYELHGTEATHGSSGQLREGDVVICISNSGETVELKGTVLAIKDNACIVIGVTGNKDSWLAKNSDIYLIARVNKEGGPLNKAPRMSILAQMLTLQALSVVLQEHHGIDVEQYIKWHPGGSLGQIS